MWVLRYREDSIQYVSIANYCFYKFMYKEVIAPLINLAIQCVAHTSVHASGEVNVRILGMFTFCWLSNIFLTSQILVYY